MADKGRIAFIFEGERRELNYCKKLVSAFFPGREVEQLLLHADENIYMLYEELCADESLNVIDVVRERNKENAKALEGKSAQDFQEVYLFFDLDRHQDNIPTESAVTAEELIGKMLAFFDNETEQGKLYISYPMCEALRDMRKGECAAYYKCRLPLSESGDYKRLSGDGNPLVDYRKYDKAYWKTAAAVFLHRCRCLYNAAVEPENLYEWYKAADISPTGIFETELELFQRDREVHVLSAFPEFLLDYFKVDCSQDLKAHLPGISNERCDRRRNGQNNRT